MSGLRATGMRLALALGLSFALWAFVSITENPEERVTFEDVPVQVRNLSPGLVMVDQNGLPDPALSNVTVIVETDRATQNELRQTDVRAYVDLGNIDTAGERRVPVNVEPTRTNIDFAVANIEPGMLAVRIEQMVNATVPITITIQGNPPFGFERGEPVVTSNAQELEQVQISGPQSRVARVELVRAVVNIDQRSASYSSALTLEPIDSNGQVIAGVSVEPNTVNVRVPIRSIVGLKRVPVLATISGDPAVGYVVTNVRASLQLINLTGSSGPLDEVEQVETAPVDITGATQTFTRTVPIRFPLLTTPQVGEPTEVTVTVQIAPITRPFQVQLPFQVQITGVRNGLIVNATPDIIEVALTGSVRALDQLDSANLVATVNISGLAPGVYVLTPQLALPTAISVSGDIPGVTVTIRLPPTATPAPTDSPPVETPDTTATPDATPSAEPSATPSPEATPGTTPTP